MASQRDPQNLKNLTKSAKWHPQTPFESSFGRFHFRKGSQALSKDLQNLKNHSFTIIKQLFSEIHPGLKIVSFGYLFGPFWDHFPSHGLSNDVQSGKKGSFKKHQNNYQILRPKPTPKWPLKWNYFFLPFGVLERFWSPFGPWPAPDPHFDHLLGHFSIIFITFKPVFNWNFKHYERIF